MDYEHKRRAVYTGLSPFFEGDALISAVKLWEKEYAYKPHYGYSEFLSKISKTKALRDQRMKMLGSIFIALEQPKEALMHIDFDPIPKTTVANKRCLVFESFVNNLLSGVQGEANQILRSGLIQSISDLGLGTFELDALGKFLDNESHDLMAELDLITMRQVVRQVEVHMKKILDRQQVIQIFDSAVHAVKPLSQQYDFDLTHIYQ